MPDNISGILIVLHVLLGYARHLSLTLERRSTRWGFSVIAQFFGTARLPVIRARLARGILRIMALQRVLFARAMHGRDVRYTNPWTREPPAPKPPAPPSTEAEPPPPQKKRTRRSYADTTPDLDHLPTLAELEAEIRRRPIGAAITDICCDLGIFPSLCWMPFWDALLPVMAWSGGSLTKLWKTLQRHQREFMPEMKATPPLCQPEESRDGIERMLGFFIGDRWPVMPDPNAAPAWAVAATGPP